MYRANLLHGAKIPYAAARPEVRDGLRFILAQLCTLQDSITAFHPGRRTYQRWAMLAAGLEPAGAAGGLSVPKGGQVGTWTIAHESLPNNLLHSTFQD
jgi:hypothetical protein